MSNSYSTSNPSTPPSRSDRPSPSKSSSTSSHHQLWPPRSSPSAVARPETNTDLTFGPLTPILTFAAYSWFAVAAMSALVGLLVTGYSLTVWDDTKRRLSGVRGLVGKGLEAGKEIMGVVASANNHPSHRERTTRIPLRHSVPRAQPGPKLHSFSSATEKSRPPPGYDLPHSDSDAGDLESEEAKPSASTSTSSSASTPPKTSFPHQSSSSESFQSNSSQGLPPRPPLSVLVASLVLTLIVVTARLMVVWWMGQQGRKNRTQAFRNGRRAYEAARANQPPRRPWFPLFQPSSSNHRGLWVD